jgi:hypothetical protein
MAVDQVLGMPQLEGTPQLADGEFAGYIDYFGFDETKKYVLPDGKQYIEFKILNEGARVKYEARTSRDVKFNRRTDDAAIKVNAGEDRHALIEESVTNWYMVRRNDRGWEPVPFSKGSKGATFSQWLERADPRIVNDLYNEIRKANPWLTDEMTVEMIDDQIQQLKEMRDQVVEREATEKNS